MFITKAEKKELPLILELQYLAYQSEAKLLNDPDIPPLKQTLPQVEVEFQKGIILKAVDENGAIVGSVRAYCEAGTVYVGKLMVHPDMRRKGIGTKLLLAVEEAYPRKRYELFTSTQSLQNIALYQRLGYKIFREEQVSEKLRFVYLEKGTSCATAYFAGGCFWCITPTFKEMDGVLDVISGYSGGDEADPVYADVKYQRTGHRETIRIDYCPEKVSFTELFEVFLNGVDPFDPDGQFIDRGHSYTLAVYYLTGEERRIAEAGIKALEESSGLPVYISVEPFKSFYCAEEEHQDYYLKHPEEFEQELIDSGRKKI